MKEVIDLLDDLAQQVSLIDENAAFAVLGARDGLDKTGTLPQSGLTVADRVLRQNAWENGQGVAQRHGHALAARDRSERKP